MVDRSSDSPKRALAAATMTYARSRALAFSFNFRACSGRADSNAGTLAAGGITAAVVNERNERPSINGSFFGTPPSLDTVRFRKRLEKLYVIQKDFTELKREKLGHHRGNGNSNASYCRGTTAGI